MISKIRNLEFALYWSTALLTTLSLYALSYWYEIEICSPDKNLPVFTGRRLGAIQDSSKCLGEETNLLGLQVIETRFLGFPAYN
jgi:hypothetical protein